MARLLSVPEHRLEQKKNKTSIFFPKLEKERESERDIERYPGEKSFSATYLV